MMLIIAAVIVHLLTFVKCLRCNQVHIKLQNLQNNLNNGCRSSSYVRVSEQVYRQIENTHRQSGREKVNQHKKRENEVNLCAFMVYDDRNSTTTSNNSKICNIKTENMKRIVI